MGMDGRNRGGRFMKRDDLKHSINAAIAILAEVERTIISRSHKMVFFHIRRAHADRIGPMIIDILE